MALEAYILVLQVLQQFQFAVGSLGKHWSTEWLHDLLDSDICIGELISGGTNQAKGAHANWLEIRIPRGDLESSPKNLGAHEFGHGE